MAKVSGAEVFAYDPENYVFWALKGNFILRKLPHGTWNRAYKIKEGRNPREVFCGIMERNGMKIVNKGNKLPRIPSLKTLERWAFDGIAEATDGCQVEPDGICVHGHKSWMIILNMI